VHAGAAGSDHGAELLQDQGGAVQVDGEDRLRRGLHRGHAGGADHRDDVAEVGGRLRERVHGLAVGHVDPLGGDGVPGVLQRYCCGLQRGLVEVGEQYLLARAGAAGDGLADAAGADDDQYVFPRRGAHRIAS
jgi:hypothetical protein